MSQVFLYANAPTAADFATAAATAGVEHIVVLSSNAVTTVADPDVNPMAAPFLAAETALRAGPVTVTVLRPGSFSSNTRQWVYGIRAQRAVDLLGETITVNRVTREQWKQSVNRYVTGDYAEALLNYWQALELHPAPISTAPFRISRADPRPASTPGFTATSTCSANDRASRLRRPRVAEPG